MIYIIFSILTVGVLCQSKEIYHDNVSKIQIIGSAQIDIKPNGEIVGNNIRVFRYHGSLVISNTRKEKVPSINLNKFGFVELDGTNNDIGTAADLNQDVRKKQTHYLRRPSLQDVKVSGTCSLEYYW